MKNFDFHLSISKEHCRSFTNGFCSTNKNQNGYPLNSAQCVAYAGSSDNPGTTTEERRLACQNACLNPPTSTDSSHPCNFDPKSFSVYEGSTASSQGRCWCYNKDSTSSSGIGYANGYNMYDLKECNNCETEGQYGCSLTGSQSLWSNINFKWCGSKDDSSTYSTFTNNRLVVASSTCVACPKGKVANSERTKCVACTAGKISSSTGCINCGTGKYSLKRVFQYNETSFNLDTVSVEDCQNFASSTSGHFGHSFSVGIWNNFPYGCIGQVSSGTITTFYWNYKLPEIEIYSGGNTKSIEYALSLDACKRVAITYQEETI